MMTEQDKTDETPEEGAATEGETKEQPAAEATDAANADAPKADAPKAAVKPAKKEKEPAPPGGPETAVVARKMAPGTPVVSRRRILQIGVWGGIGAAVAAMGASFLDFVYPRNVAGFGGTVSVASAAVPSPGQKVQIPAGRFWLVNLTEEQGGPGLLALWWKFGPAPRPLDTMDLTVGADGRVTVDTGSVTPGAPDNPDRAVRI